MAPDAELRREVRHLAPSGRATQHATFARLIAAVFERAARCLSGLLRSLATPRLDELALSTRWRKLSYRFGEDAPGEDPRHPWPPILLDTTYFGPFAALLAAGPGGGRALPGALTTSERTTREACFPPLPPWPDPSPPRPPAAHRRPRPAPTAAQIQRFTSQPGLERRRIRRVGHRRSPAVRGVLVADRGFASADLFAWRRRHRRDFVIRIEATTHVGLGPAGPSRPVAEAVPVQPGAPRRGAGATSGQQARVPVHRLAAWAPDQAAPWYRATPPDRADWTERLSGWRMRLESRHRDEKTGVLLRQGGDQHALRTVLPLPRLWLALIAAQWLCARVGLPAGRDLAAPPQASALEDAPPTTPPDRPLLERGPAARLDAPLRRPWAPQRRPARRRGPARPGLGPDRPPLRPLARHLARDLDSAPVPLATPLPPQTLVARRLTQSGAPQGSSS